MNAKDLMRRARRLLPAVVPLALLLAGCDTEGLLEVELPGNVTAEDVERAALATVMRNSAIGDFECVWDSYVGGSALHSDQYIQSSGNVDMARQMLRDITADHPRYATQPCSASFGLFTPMHTARVLLEQHFDRLQGFTDEGVANRRQYMAEMRVYGGFTYVAFGEGFCGTPLDGEERARTREELLEIAVERFTEGLQLAQQANQEHLVNAALVGRARANLSLERYADAISDAELVPEGFRFDATREEGDNRRWNKLENISRRTGPAPSHRATATCGGRESRIPE